MNSDYIIFGIFAVATIILVIWMIVADIREARKFKVYKFRNGKWEKK